MRRLHSAKRGWLAPKTLLGNFANATLVNNRAFIARNFHVARNALQLRRGINRANIRVLIHGVAHAQRRHAMQKFRLENVRDGFLNQQSTTRATHLSLVVENSKHGAFNRLIDSRIRENKLRALAAKFHGEAHRSARATFHNAAANFSTARECDLVKAFMLSDGFASLRSTRDNIHNARRKIAIAKKFRQPQSRERRGLRGFQHASVAARKRWRQFPRGHHERKVPRNNLSAHANWSGLMSTSNRVAQLVAPARVVEKMFRRLRNIRVATFLNGLAVVQRLQHGKFARAFLQLSRHTKQQLAALAGLHARPTTQRLARRLIRAVHIALASFRHAGQMLFRGGIDHIHGAPAFGRHKLAIYI